MDGFWSSFIKPLIEAAAPLRMMEVGTETGGHTAMLLGYSARTGCKLELLDTRAAPALGALLAQYPGAYAFHPLRGLEAIPLVPPCDVVVMDSDPNWFTVFHELQLLFARAAEARAPAPLVLLHNVGWPYGRRDMYREPGIIPERHPYAQRGIVPGCVELVDGGAEGTKFNALHEGGPANGVLTAAEDFVASWPAKIALHVLPYLGGLAVMVPEARDHGPLADAVARCFGSDALQTMSRVLEQERCRLAALLASRTVLLTQRSEALGRARSKIAALVAGHGSAPVRD